MILRKLLVPIIAIFGIWVPAMGQNVEKFTVKENTYYGTKAIPEEITGLYKYEKDKEPIVDLKLGGTGYFQMHGVKPYPIEYWIETDVNGKIQKRTSEINSNYIVVLIVKYGSNGESGPFGSRAGTYNRIDVAMSFDTGFAIVL